MAGSMEITTGPLEDTIRITMRPDPGVGLCAFGDAFSIEAHRGVDQHDAIEMMLKLHKQRCGCKGITPSIERNLVAAR